DEAVAQLASVIADRDATRHARWQAVLVAPELIGERRELWDTLAERVRASNGADSEMPAAISALALVADGRAGEAAQLAGAAQAGDPNPHLKLFCALLDQRRGQTDAARDGFLEVLSADPEANTAAAFDFAGDAPLRLLIRMYLSTGQPRAALKLAGADAELKTKGVDERHAGAGEGVEAASDLRNRDEHPSAKYRTLQERSRERRSQSRIELLGLLSEAAERTGDISRALDYAHAKLDLLGDKTGRADIATRIERLSELKRAKASRRSPGLIIDRELIARK
ncbi:MAG: hypothetical protein LC754_09300, partial [Acidobacteria bacterium]|nr:hypothetical protein [Acidobacteriota bacterium]